MLVTAICEQPDCECWVYSNVSRTRGRKIGEESGIVKGCRGLPLEEGGSGGSGGTVDTAKVADPLAWFSAAKKLSQNP
jgi:hypothetical protein